MAIESLLPGGLTIQAIIDQAIGSVTGKTDADVSAIGTSIDSLKTFVTSNLSTTNTSISNTITSTLNTIKDAIVSLPGSIATGVGNAVSSVTTSIGNLIASGQQQVSDIVAGLQTGFTSNITAIQDGIGDLVDGVKQAYTNASNTVKTAIDAAIKSSTDWIGNTINAAKTGITSSIDAAKTWVSNAIDNTKTAVTQAVTSARDWVTNAVNSAKDNVTTLATNLRQGLTDFGTSVWDSVTGTINNVGTWIDTQVQAGKDAVTNTIDSVDRWLSDTYDTVANSVQGAIDNAVDGVQSAIDYSKTAVINAYSAVQEWFRDVIWQMQVGIQSISDSLTRSWNDLRDWYVNDFQTWLDDFQTNIGDFFKNLPENAKEWYGSFEKSLQTDNKTMGNAFTRLLAGDSGAALEIVVNANPGTQENYLAGLFYGIATLGPIMSATAGAIVAPAAEELMQASWLNNPVKLLPPDMLVTAMIRNAYPESQTKTDIQAQGYKPEFVEVMQAAIKPLLSAADIQRAYLLKRFDTDEAITRLKHIGFNNDESTLIIQNTEQLLSANELVSAFRRRLVSDLQAVDEMGRQGLDKARAEVLLGLAETLPQPQDVQLEFIRGFITEQDHDEMMGRIGYSQEQIDLIKQLYNLLPPVQDLIRMAVREVFSPEIAERFGQFEDYPKDFTTYAAKLGLSEDWAKAYWAAHWDLPSPQMGFEMLHRNVIDEDELKLLMRALDIMPYWRDRLMAISYHPLTRVDVRRMYGLQVIDRDGVKRAYLDLGYNETNAELMTEFTVRYESQGDVDEQAEMRALTRSVVESAYSRGIIDRQDAIVRLAGLLYQPEDIDLLLSIWDYNKSVKDAPDYSDDLKRQAIAIVKDAYRRRLTTTEQAMNQLKLYGYGEAEANSQVAMIDYQYNLGLKDKIAARMVDAVGKRIYSDENNVSILAAQGFLGSEINQIIAEGKIDADYRTRQMSVTQIRDIWLKGIIDDATFHEELRGLGYAEKHVQWLVALWSGGE